MCIFNDILPPLPPSGLSTARAMAPTPLPDPPDVYNIHVLKAEMIIFTPCTPFEVVNTKGLNCEISEMDKNTQYSFRKCDTKFVKV